MNINLFFYIFSRTLKFYLSENETFVYFVTEEYRSCGLDATTSQHPFRVDGFFGALAVAVVTRERWLRAVRSCASSTWLDESKLRKFLT